VIHWTWFLLRVSRPFVRSNIDLFFSNANFETFTTTIYIYLISKYYANACVTRKKSQKSISVGLYDKVYWRETDCISSAIIYNIVFILRVCGVTTRYSHLNCKWRAKGAATSHRAERQRRTPRAYFYLSNNRSYLLSRHTVLYVSLSRRLLYT
jgi:hypothetical protein